MEINKRILHLRTEKKLNQEEFGIKIGVSKFTISGYENGKRSITDRVISDICREFNVNEHWLRTGEGEMFEETTESIIADLVDRYNLDDLDKKLIMEYSKLNNEQRLVIKDFIRNSLATETKKVSQDVSKITSFPIKVVYEDYTEDEDEDEGVEEFPVYLQLLSAGAGNFIDDDYYETMEFPAGDIPNGAEFGMRISGDSMEPTISNKQIVFIKPTPDIYSGEIGVFMQDGECFCKRLEVDHDRRVAYLVSDNKAYKKIKVTDNCRTIGKVLL